MKTDSSDIQPIGFEGAFEITSKLKKQIESYIFGQESLIEETIATFLAGGHILLTGAPGLAKTTLVRVFSKCLGLQSGRVQFTPDLLPSDIIGSEVLNIDPKSGKRTFKFNKGPIFTNLLLADEINRASPRTQSAMLESMQERQATVNGDIYYLPKPFMVFATQNPFESEGTFPLPEAQLDRFLLHSLVEYPNEEAELKILSEHSQNQLIGEDQSNTESQNSIAIKANVVAQLLEQTKRTLIPPELIKLINQLIRSTRPDDDHCPPDYKQIIWYGAGPRAGISLISASKSIALLEQSECVRWRHIKRVARPVLRHRIRLSAQSFQQEIREDDIIDKLIEKIEELNSQICQESK